MNLSSPGGALSRHLVCDSYVRVDTWMQGVWPTTPLGVTAPQCPCLPPILNPLIPILELDSKLFDYSLDFTLRYII